MKFTVRAGGLTDVGLKRDHNEDSVLVAQELGLYAVADGMGGHAAGEVASKTAITTVQDFVEKAKTDKGFTWPYGMQKEFSQDENILVSAVKLANREVCAMSEKDESYGGMGTTFAAIYLPEEKIHVCHVGDSRVYRFRNGELEPMTQDHSWVNEQLQRNIISEEEARQHRWRNVITRALGSRDAVEIDLTSVDAEAGDIFLLCSDGLTGMITDDQIADVLKEKGDDPEGACKVLIELSNEAGGLDNISAIIVRIES